MTDSETNERVRALVTRTEDHCPGEGIHAQRVAVYATAIGYEAGLRGDGLVELRWAAQLHDIGKLSIPRSILLGESPRPEDFADFRQHPLWATSYLKQEGLGERVIRAIRLHHERWDGSGYPMGYCGQQTPIEARIIGIAEWFDVAANGAYWYPAGDEAQALLNVQYQPFDPDLVVMLLRVQPLIQPIDRP